VFGGARFAADRRTRDVTVAFHDRQASVTPVQSVAHGVPVASK